MIDRKYRQLSVVKQVQILGINRAGVYYRRHKREVRKEEKTLIKEINEQYMKTPFYGRPKMTKQLNRLGYPVGEGVVRRLMKKMGIKAIYCKPKTSIANPGHKKYPYLLRGVEVVRPNHVWSTDITYIRTRQGFMYLTAVIDWASRYVLSWRLSNTLDSHFCIEALQESLRYGKPDIFNTDQGSQFTSMDFTEELLSRDIQISMDGKGRALDNVRIERLWRSLKYEDVFIHDYQSVSELKEGLGKYIQFYNTGRIHEGLNYRTPEEVYYEGCRPQTAIPVSPDASRTLRAPAELLTQSLTHQT